MKYLDEQNIHLKPEKLSRGCQANFHALILYPLIPKLQSLSRMIYWSIILKTTATYSRVSGDMFCCPSFGRSPITVAKTDCVPNKVLVRTKWIQIMSSPRVRITWHHVIKHLSVHGWWAVFGFVDHNLSRAIILMAPVSSAFSWTSFPITNICVPFSFWDKLPLA